MSKDVTMRDKVAVVIRALYLCGENYTNESCHTCPFKKKCMPGDNTALLEATAELLEELQMALVAATALRDLFFPEERSGRK